MHDIERGHKCSKCGRRSICTIEDGMCEGEGLCDSCLRDVYMRQAQRELDDGRERYDG